MCEAKQNIFSCIFFLNPSNIHTDTIMTKSPKAILAIAILEISPEKPPFLEFRMRLAMLYEIFIRRK
jgi:hypothetical protein